MNIEVLKMKISAKVTFTLLAVLFGQACVAQSATRDSAEQLKMAALEALILAPSNKVLPLVDKVLAGEHSTELKERALFILSQNAAPEAQATLFNLAQVEGGELQKAAIRMIGVGGNSKMLSGLRAVYEAGGPDTRDAILAAYMIANDKESVLHIASNAQGEDFDAALHMLGVMGAHKELRAVRGRAGGSGALIEAYAISGDYDSLRALAEDSSNTKVQADAIKALGIVGSDKVQDTLVDLYRGATTSDIRNAALEGLLISGHDDGILELYRGSHDAAEKKTLLQTLLMMGSDSVWPIIESALGGDG
jgi:HEAT repeat protein